LSGYFVHDDALCESDTVGEGSRIWAFAWVREGARIGREANVCSHVLIEPGVVVGDRVTIKSGVQLFDGVRLEDDVFVGPNATFASGPPAREGAATPGPTVVERGASIGANATILSGTTIGHGAMVGAGAVVTRSVPPNAIVVGVPARIRGYVDGAAQTPLDPPRAERREPPTEPRVRPSQVPGVTIRDLPLHRDLRGSLVASEVGNEIPFTVERSFVVFDVPSRETRGEHAHRQCHQFLVCVRGACSLSVTNGEVHENLRLSDPHVGVHVPPMIWAAQFDHTPDATLLVLASHVYDASDYIRSYPDFLAEAGAQRG
jgi:acetyltransferase-like isoleucine patch superfamily enzyme